MDDKREFDRRMVSYTKAVDLSKKADNGTSSLDTGVSSSKIPKDPVGDVEYYNDYSRAYRWLILTFFSILAIVLGPAFMNWPPLAQILSDQGAYRSLCVDQTKPCDASSGAITTLYVASVASMFGLDLIAGILLDFFGGKVCTLFGIVLQLVGWLLLAFCGPNFHGFLAALIFISAGADPGFFGLLSVANLFPEWESTIVAVLGAARSISYVNFLLIEKVLESFSLRTVCLGYFVLVVVFGVGAFFFVPHQCYPKQAPGCSLSTEPDESKVPLSKFLNRSPAVEFRSLGSQLKSEFRGSFKHVFTYPFAIFCIVPFLTLLRNNYYNVSYMKHLPDIYKIHSIAAPFSFIPCPIIGIFADRVSTMLTVIGLAVCGAISMAVVLSQHIAFQWISMIFNFFFISFCISQFYCYVAYVYPQEQMGKLIGISLLIGGLLALIARPMNAYAWATNNYVLMDSIIVGVEVVVIFLSLFLYFKMELPLRRKAKALESAEEKLADTTV